MLQVCPIHDHSAGEPNSSFQHLNNGLKHCSLHLFNLSHVNQLGGWRLVELDLWEMAIASPFTPRTLSTRRLENQTFV